MLQLLTSVALWHATFSLKCYVYEKLEDPIELVEAGDHDTCEITIKDPCGRAFVELRITRGLFKDEDGDDFDCFGGWETTCFCLADFCNGDVHKVKVAYDDVNDYPEECHDNVMQTLEWIMDDIDGRIQRRRSGKWKAMGKTRGKRRRKRSFQLPGANNTKLLLAAPSRPASQRTTVLAKKLSSPKNTPSTKPRPAASTRAKARTTPPAIKKPPGRTTKKKTGNKDDPLSKLRPKNEKKKPEPPSVRKKISFITLMIIVAVVICVVLCVGFAIVRKKFQKSKMAKSTSKMSAAVPQPQTSSSSASANAPSKENV